jgi:hypothetical protein
MKLTASRGSLKACEPGSSEACAGVQRYGDYFQYYAPPALACPPDFWRLGAEYGLDSRIKHPHTAVWPFHHLAVSSPVPCNLLQIDLDVSPHVFGHGVEEAIELRVLEIVLDIRLE